MGNTSFISLAISIFLLLPLVQVVVGKESFGDQDYDFNGTPLPPPPVNDIVAKWKATEVAVKNIFLRMVKNLIPLSYKIASTTNISATCTNHMLDIMHGITQKQVWAVKMVDAAGKLPPGLMGGSPTSLGDYDTCLKVKNPENKFKGKYCPVDISVPLPARRLFVPVEKGVPELNNVMDPGSFGEELVKQAQYLYTFHIRTTLCLPSTCTRKEVFSIAKKSLEIAKLKLNVNVPFCDTEDDFKEYTAGEISIIILFIILLTIVIIGTSLDVILTLKSANIDSPETGYGLKCILCFSAYTNFSKLLKKDDNPETLTIFHGMRVLSMFWIILCHSAFTVNFHAHDGLVHAKELARSFWFTPIINGFLSVDIFFFMSAVLVAYVCMRMREKVNVFLFLLRRYWRLTPAMMLVSAFFSLAVHFGSGPIWRETYINLLGNNCKERGWWNFFYLNNYLYSSKICMGWTWYLSADLQLFLICLYPVLLLKKNFRRGISVICLLVVVGILLTAFSHIYYNLPPTYLQSFPHYDDWYYFGSKGYTPAHIHLSVYAIGLYVGYVLAVKKVHIPKHLNIMGWIVTIPTMITLVFCVYHWNQGNIPGQVVSAVYGSTHRVIWTLCLAFITISCTAGYGGIVHRILSWDAFVPLGRLTFMAYLIHYGIIYMYTASTRSTMTYNLRTLLFQYFAVTTVTYILAAFLTLVLESPFFSLEKLLIESKRERKYQSVPTVNGIERKSSKDSV